MCILERFLILRCELVGKTRDRKVIEGLPVESGRLAAHLFPLPLNSHWEDSTYIKKEKGNSGGEKR
jgi:hypothetical protein